MSTSTANLTASAAPPLHGLLAAALRDPVLADVVERADRPSGRITGPIGLRPFVAAALAAPRVDGGAGARVCLVTATGREAENAAAAVADLIGDEHVVVFPSWETLPHERLSPAADTVGRRVSVLRRLAHPEEHPAGLPSVIVTTIRSLVQPMAPDLGEMAPVRLAPGDTVGLGDVVERLVELAYHRVELVERRGEIAVRGGILDIFAQHRAAPRAGGVLRRRDPRHAHLRRIRPAIHRARRRACGAPLPRDPAHRRRPGTGGRTDRGRDRRPDVDGDGRQDRRRGAGRGDGGADPGAAARPIGAAARAPAGGDDRPAGRSRTDPDPRRGPGPHRAGVPGRVVDGRRGRWPGTHRPGRVCLPPAGRNPRRHRGSRPGRCGGSPRSPATSPGSTAAASRRTDGPRRTAGRPAGPLLPRPTPRRRDRRRRADGARRHHRRRGGRAWHRRARRRDPRRAGRRRRERRRRHRRSTQAGGRHGRMRPARRRRDLHRQQPGDHHRGRPHRESRRRPRDRDQAAGPAAQRHRPRDAAAGRLRGARPARHRPVHPDGPAGERRRHQGLPGGGVRAEQARPPRRPAVRARPTRSTSCPATSAARRPR